MYRYTITKNRTLSIKGDLLDMQKVDGFSVYMYFGFIQQKKPIIVEK